MRNDITDLIFRCKVAYLSVPVGNRRYCKMVTEKLAEMTVAGSEHIEEAQMKDFIHSVAKFEKYVRELK